MSEAMMTPLLETMATLLITVLTALAGFVMNWLAKKTGSAKLEQDSIIRGYLEQAIDNGVRLAISKKSGINLDIDHNERYAVAEAASTFVSDKTPDAVKRFRLDRKQIEDIAMARINAIRKEK